MTIVALRANVCVLGALLLVLTACTPEPQYDAHVKRYNEIQAQSNIAFSEGHSATVAISMTSGTMGIPLSGEKGPGPMLGFDGKIHWFGYGF